MLVKEKNKMETRILYNCNCNFIPTGSNAGRIEIPPQAVHLVRKIPINLRVLFSNFNLFNRMSWETVKRPW